MSPLFADSLCDRYLQVKDMRVILIVISNVCTGVARYFAEFGRVATRQASGDHVLGCYFAPNVFPAK